MMLCGVFFAWYFRWPSTLSRQPLPLLAALPPLMIPPVRLPQRERHDIDAAALPAKLPAR